MFNRTFTRLLPAVLLVILVSALVAPLPMLGPAPARAMDVFQALDLARRGQQALAEGDAVLAEDLVSQALASGALKRMDTAVALKIRGAARQRLGMPDKALEDYSEAIALAPSYAEAYHNRAAAWLELGQPASAVTDLDKALVLRPGWDIAYFTRGRARFEQGDVSGAVTDFTAVLEADAGNALAWWRRGRALAAQGRRSAAEADFTRAMELAPDTVEPLLDRGRLRLDSGDAPGAMRDFLAATEAAPDEPRAWFELALARQSMDDLDGAEAAWGTVISLAKEPAVLADAHNNRGVARDMAGRREDAVDDFGRAIALVPGRALSYANRGRTLLALGRPEEAAADLGRAIAASPPMAAMHRARGEAYLALGKAASAGEDFTAALALEPEDVQLRMLRGRARYMAADWAGADEDLSAWLNGPSPQDADSRRLRGLARYMAGRWQAAERDFRSLVLLRPETSADPDWEARLWLRLTRLRGGLDTEPLPASVCDGTDEDWPCPLLRFHEGQLSVPALLDAAGDEPVRACTAALHAGTAALAAGQRVEAVRLFRAALDTGPANLPQRLAAATELSRLGF